jgi:hypothetical protein
LPMPPWRGAYRDWLEIQPSPWLRDEDKGMKLLVRSLLV